MIIYDFKDKKDIKIIIFILFQFVTINLNYYSILNDTLLFR